MALYLKILGFLKPYWKRIILSTLLTFLYVFFNMISIWVSVDFMGELFNPTEPESVSDSTHTVVEPESAEEEADITDAIAPLGQLGVRFNAYDRIKRTIKRLIIQEDRFETLKWVCIIIFFSFLLK